MAARSFEARVKSLVTSLVKGGATAVMLANEAMTKFHTDGDIRQLQFLANNLPIQGCPELLKFWAKSFAPISITKEGVWSKDKSKDATPFNLDAALKTSYFDMVKRKADDTKLFVAADLRDSVENLVKRYTKLVADGKVEADSISAVNILLQNIEAFAARNFDIAPVAVVTVKPAKRIRKPANSNGVTGSVGLAAVA